MHNVPHKRGPAITVSKPYPLLDPGAYEAICTEATCAWSNTWKKWIARLVLEPQDYTGRPYIGKLCKFLQLGSNREGPHAGSRSAFRMLLVEVNGDQPIQSAATVEVFQGLRFEIVIDTVTQNRKGEAFKPEFFYSVVRDIHFSRGPNTATQNCVAFNPLTLLPSNTPTQQHDNTPLASSTLKKSARGKSLGSNHQQHNYPEGGAGETISASPSKEPITLEAEPFTQPLPDRREMLRQQAVSLQRNIGGER
jgi:hypothetical protein